MVLVEFVEVVSYPEVGLGLGFGVCNDRHLVAIVLYCAVYNWWCDNSALRRSCADHW